MHRGPFDLDDDAAYQAWRAGKLSRAPRTLDDLLVEVRDPRALSATERNGLLDRCRRANGDLRERHGQDRRD